MKIALGQCNPTIGITARSLCEWVERAKQVHARLILFPELAVTGYPPRDLLDIPHFIQENISALDQLRVASKGIAIVCGFVDEKLTQKGRFLYNAAIVFCDQKEVTRYHKRLLPDYDVFDEQRYFEPGGQAVSFELDGKKIGLSICEDLWSLAQNPKRVYTVDPLNDFRSQKLDLLLNLSASPFHLGKPEYRERLFQSVAQTAQATVVFCNQVGGNDELIFDGGSMVLSPTGKTLRRAKTFLEDLLVFDTDVAGTCSEPWPTSEAQWLTEALELGLKDYVRKCGAQRVCLGLSGGIDSAVSAVLAVRALGKENVKGVSLPSRFTSAESRRDAKALANGLEIEFQEISIDALFSQFQKELSTSLKSELASLTLENLQPRIRMTLLMALANEERRLLLNTSNKSEIAVGYSTLYGDSAGAVSLLGDVLKTQVYAMARFYNQSKEYIPRHTLERGPSAELRAGQLDQESLPPYTVLDALIQEVLENHKTSEELVELGFSKELVDQFFTLYYRSEFKRWQLPPALRVSQRAFGSGRRIPIAATRL